MFLSQDKNMPTCSVILTSDRISGIMGPLEFIYYIGYSIKKSHSLKRQKRLPCKVISIGNITIGGTGKTPAVIAISEEAVKRGFNPVILTRGYRGKAKGPFFVDKNHSYSLSPLYEVAGDEPALIAEKLKDAHVVKCANRYKGGMFALQFLPLNPDRPLIFILDDGFQHWRLFRDMDILLIDSSNPFGNRRLLPSGILREPLTEIKRADVVLITRTNHVQAYDGKEKDIQCLTEDIRRYNADAQIFRSSHIPKYLKTISGRELAVDTISGKSVLGFCGIGNPESFKGTLSGLRVEIKGFISFRDHYRYSARDITRINEMAKGQGVDWIITTEKDIMRLKGFELPGNLVSLGIEFVADGVFYDRIFRED